MCERNPSVAGQDVLERDVGLVKGTTACRYDLPYETSRDGVGRG